MSFEKREFQEIGFNNIIKQGLLLRRLAIQSATGSGKTVIMSRHVEWIYEKVKEALNNNVECNKRIVVIADREKLIEQISKTFMARGIWIHVCTTNTKVCPPNTYVYICTSQMAYIRLKKDSGFFRDVHTVICDEAHTTIHNKTIDILEEHYKPFVFGYTATPIYSTKAPMRDFYNGIVCVADVPELIRDGFLIPEKTYSIIIAKEYMDNLVIDKKNNDYTSKSITSLYGRNEVMEQFKYALETKRKGRTIIFCSSIEHCKTTCDFLKKEGYNAMSVTSDNKKDIELSYKFIQSDENNILVSVEMLTKGYDEPMLETVIILRTTTSLSLFLQMAGRGGRLCKSICKEHFVLIDLGNNIVNSDGSRKFGLWSDGRDWEAIYWGTEEKKAKAAAFKVCPECALILPAGCSVCHECGYVFTKKTKQKERKEPAEFEIIELFRGCFDTESSKKTISAAIKKRDERGYKESWIGFELMEQTCTEIKNKVGLINISAENQEKIVSFAIDEFLAKVKLAKSINQNVSILAPSGQFWRQKCLQFLGFSEPKKK